MPLIVSGGHYIQSDWLSRGVGRAVNCVGGGGGGGGGGITTNLISCPGRWTCNCVRGALQPI